MLFASIVILGGSVLFIASKPQNGPKPKNIILLIGDGMGTAQISSARAANNGSLNLDRFPKMGLMTTLDAEGQPSDDLTASSALATGHIGKAGSFGLDENGKPAKNLFETASSVGKKTGLVITSHLGKGTPLAFLGHGNLEDEDFDPLNTLVSSPISIYIGGGSKFHEKSAGNPSRLKELKYKGFTVYDRLKKADKIKGVRSAVFAASSSVKPVTNGRGDFMLKAWQAAENLLAPNSMGFVLVVEGSHIGVGSAGHSQEYVNTELIDFDQVVGEALDFAKKTNNTLVVVLGDREVGGMTLLKGKSGELKAKWTTEESTGTMVPIFAYGPGSAELTGAHSNIEIHNILKDFISNDTQTPLRR